MSAPAISVGTKLPELSLYGDPTFIVSTAIATRDYQDVHHDRDKAQAKALATNIQANAQKAEALDEELNGVQLNLDAAVAKAADARDRIASAQAETDRLKALVRQRASAVYRSAAGTVDRGHQDRFIRRAR